jgi:hypothetical protein
LRVLVDTAAGVDEVPICDARTSSLSSAGSASKKVGSIELVAGVVGAVDGAAEGGVVVGAVEGVVVGVDVGSVSGVAVDGVDADGAGVDVVVFTEGTVGSVVGVMSGVCSVGGCEG